MLKPAIIDAFVGGLSVIEISRVLTVKPGHVHDLLRAGKAIEPITRREKPLALVMSNGIWIKALQSHGLSLERWCQGWAFLVSDVVSVINGDVTARVEEGAAALIREALSRDLPTQYRLVFKDEPNCIIRAIREKSRHYSYLVEWDATHNCYVGTVKGLVAADSEVDLAASGLTPSLALEAAERAGVEYRQVKRLRHAVSVVQGRHAGPVSNN